MHVWPFYGLATLLAVSAAAYGRRERRSGDTLGAAFVLAALWGLWNLSHWFVPTPYNQFFPLLDYAVCAGMAWAWRRTLRSWKVLLILLFLAQCILHAAYFASTDHSFRVRYAYDLRQNLIYIAQLACVSTYGIRRLHARLTRPRRIR